MHLKFSNTYNDDTVLFKTRIKKNQFKFAKEALFYINI